MIPWRIWAPSLVYRTFKSHPRLPASLQLWPAYPSRTCAVVKLHQLAPYFTRHQPAIPKNGKHCLFCGHWILKKSRLPKGVKYCSKKCSYKPKAQGRALTQLFAQLLRQRKEIQDRPIVLCSELVPQIAALRETMKEFKNGVELENVRCAARRMVVFEKCSEGLMVRGVSAQGKEVDVESAQGDWGLRLEGERPKDSEEPTS